MQKKRKELGDISSLLEYINGPADLKKLSYKELAALSQEIREQIIKTVLENGGHLASNLGVVELTIALHRIFESPKDQIIWDVGHQCYTHKLLTGRKDQFQGLRQKDGISGFPKRDESPHDVVNTGHASTSISVASGILAAKKVKGEEGKVIAVIGDGALTGGMALEALNYSGSRKDDLIIILNDNEMSIHKNVGALSNYLTKINLSKTYQTFRSKFDRTMEKIPLLGSPLLSLINRFKRAVKVVLYRKTLFTDFGFNYFGPINGHSLESMEQVFSKVHNVPGPSLVHVITQKGKGYSLSEQNPSDYHGVSAAGKSGKKSFTQVFSAHLMKLAEKDEKITAITAAMGGGTGLDRFHKTFPHRFFDVGIAEQNAVTFGASMGLEGLKPVVVLYSTFLQRAVDQVIHDVAISGMPLLLGLDRAGIVPGDGETHQGLFDIPLLRCIPEVLLLSPCCEEELKAMMDYALSHKKAVAIRYPKAICPSLKDKSLDTFMPGAGSFMQKEGSSILLMGTGSLYPELEKAHHDLRDKGVIIDQYSLATLSPLDKDRMRRDLGKYKEIFFLEDGMEKGGLGEELHRLKKELFPHSSLHTRGVGSQFLAQGTREELLGEVKMDGPSIAEWVLEESTLIMESFQDETELSANRTLA